MAARGIFSQAYLPVTLGLLSAIFGSAFDTTAVTAIMPRIAQDLGDVGAYPLTFAATYAASVFGMVLAGLASDRIGSIRTFGWSAGIMSIGLLLAVFAPTMSVFLISRAVQGLGSGGLVVAIYAIIAEAYPNQLQQRMFAAFSGAYLIPSLIGPGLAGLVAEWATWHVVFLATFAGIGFSTSLVLTKARERISATNSGRHVSGVSSATGAGPGSRTSWRTVLIAAGLALGAGLMNYASQLHLGVALPLFTASLVLVLVTIRKLIPRGTLRAARGVPRVIASRGLFESLLTAEIYMPLLMATVYGLDPSMTGLALSASGLTWFLGSEVQSRKFDALPTPLLFRIGAGVGGAGLCVCAITALAELPWVLAVVGWGLTSLGMGFSYPRLCSLPMQLCRPNQIGFVSSAQQITAMTSMVAMISVAALLQVGLPQQIRFAAIYAVVAAVAALVWWLWNPRVTEPVPESDVPWHSSPQRSQAAS